MTPILMRAWGAGSEVTVVIGGCGTPIEHLEPLAKDLARERRVLVPCFHGYGGTPRNDASYTLEQQQTALEDALVAAEATSVSVIGLSLGAYRACLLAATSTRIRVTKLGLLGGFTFARPEDRAQYRQFAMMVRTQTVPPGFIAARFLSAPYRAAHPEVADAIDRSLDVLDPEGVAMELDAVSHCEDLRPILERIEAPAIIRVGEADAATPIAVAKEAADRIPRAKLQVVPCSGHLLLLEDYAATLAALTHATA